MDPGPDSSGESRGTWLRRTGPLSLPTHHPARMLKLRQRWIGRRPGFEKSRIAQAGSGRIALELFDSGQPKEPKARVGPLDQRRFIGRLRPGIVLDPQQCRGLVLSDRPNVKRRLMIARLLVFRRGLGVKLL